MFLWMRKYIHSNYRKPNLSQSLNTTQLLYLYFRFPQQWYWGFWSSEMLDYKAGLTYPDVSTQNNVSIFKSCLFPEESRTTPPLPSPPKIKSLHLWGHDVLEESKTPSPLKMETICSFETMASLNPATQFNTMEDQNSQCKCRFELTILSLLLI